MIIFILAVTIYVVLVVWFSAHWIDKERQQNRQASMSRHPAGKKMLYGGDLPEGKLDFDRSTKDKMKALKSFRVLRNDN